MLKGAAYGMTVAMFSFVLYATVRVKDDILILACIPPAFVAAITGFVMWLYTFKAFGPVEALLAVLLPLPVAWALSRRYSARDLVISIYLAWTVGLVCALVAFKLPPSA